MAFMNEVIKAPLKGENLILYSTHRMNLAISVTLRAEYVADGAHTWDYILIEDLTEPFKLLTVNSLRGKFMPST
jgi:hypothetical protein